MLVGDERGRRGVGYSMYALRIHNAWTSDFSFYTLWRRAHFSETCSKEWLISSAGYSWGYFPVESYSILFWLSVDELSNHSQSPYRSPLWKIVVGYCWFNSTILIQSFSTSSPSFKLEQESLPSEFITRVLKKTREPAIATGRVLSKLRLPILQFIQVSILLPLKKFLLSRSIFRALPFECRPVLFARP